MDDKNNVIDAEVIAPAEEPKNESLEKDSPVLSRLKNTLKNDAAHAVKVLAKRRAAAKAAKKARKLQRKRRK